MRYCVDEEGFAVDVPAAEYFDLLLDLVSLIERCREEDQDVARVSTIHDAPTLPGVRLLELLYEGACGIDRDVRLAVGAALDRCIDWEASEPWPDPFTVSIRGQVVDALSMARAHAAAERSAAVSLLVLARSPRVGREPVTRDGRLANVHFISDDAGRIAFLREVPEIESMGAEAYMALARHAFPALVFAPELAAQTRRFSEPFESLRATLSTHLAALNDAFQLVLRGERYDPARVQARFEAEQGVRCSPESGNTKRDAKAWAERLVSIAGRQVRCEWHTKLAPNKDRIYFNPGRPDEGVPITIGIFHEHLP